MKKLKLNTEYIFGEKSIDYLEEFLLSNKAKKISLLFGGGSIKKNGLYQSIISIAKKINIEIQEISGIQPNPRAVHIVSSSILVREFKPDYIVAAGGGSVIDASKIISVMAQNPHWKKVEDYFNNQSSIKEPCTPIISIITLAGTASENNGGSVITFDEPKFKKSILTPSGVPILAIEDPTYTLTLGKWQTASGSFDCFSHLLEQYFQEDLFSWTKEFIFSNMRNVLKYGPIAYEDLKNYEARENLMFTSSMALNGLANFNTKGGDWNVHIIEHAISGRWDVTHGAGLALVTPYYIKYRSDHYPWFKERVISLGKEVLGVSTVEGVLNFITNWIKKLGLPKCWLDFNEITSITDVDIDWLIDHILNKDNGSLPEKDYRTILKNIPINSKL